MEWVYLIIAGAGEVIGVTSINNINQKGNKSAYLLLIGGFLLSFTCLSIAMETLPMSTAYAVWTGIGTVGSTLIGMLFFNESKDWRRIFFISLILSAAIGLKIIG